MALTSDEAKEAMRITTLGMLRGLETGTAIVNENGARFQFAIEIPGSGPAWGMSYVFVSEDRAWMRDLNKALSSLLA